MRHLYRCPLRWADLDMLGHVNNVVYVDYLQEARVDLVRTLLPSRPDDLAEGVVVVRHEVTYLAPLGLRFRPVSVECWVTEIGAATFTMGYEVFHEDPEAPGGRRTYVRATTVLAPYVFAEERPRRLRQEERAALAPYVEPGDEGAEPVGEPVREGSFHYPVHVRFSDVDVFGHVNNVVYVEYFQEARIRMMSELTRGTGRRPGLVVAQLDVDYLRPLLLRPEPYDCWTRVSRLGGRSMTVESRIADGEVTLARSRCVAVFYDAQAQRSVEPSPELRELLTPTC